MLAGQPALAHPMGNFSINHYAHFEARGNDLSLRYILDFAEIPTAQRMPQLDFNGDNKVSGAEKSSFLKSQAMAFLQGISLQVDARDIKLTPQSTDLELRPGAGGLDTLRVTVDTSVPLKALSTHRVDYLDNNFSERTGWMEIIAVATGGNRISDSNASSTDRSHGLTIFPLDAGIVPPRQNGAAFTVNLAGASVKSRMITGLRPQATAQGESVSTVAPATNDQTPQNRFTQSIAEEKLTPGLVLGGLLVAFLFGAVHALSPGHGKTMVAAYLVGSRGTPRHAVLLGLVVTITHTFGVFALGLALLFASRYVLPERLFPALSAASGMLIFGVGLWLLMSRWQLLTTGHSHHDHHDHDHHDQNHPHHDHPHGHHSHEGHEHIHEEIDHGHTHDGHTHDGHTHVHSHGGKAHSHAVPEGPITMRTLVALGISGGIVPCPEALVVLLAAVKLHRIGYGMILITAFSLGLAAALIAIGMLVVSARQKLSRLKGFGEDGFLTRYLPLGSAAIITLIGVVLTIHATGTGLP